MRRLCSLLAAGLAAVAPAHGAAAGGAQPTEMAVKAAFLPKFARYVELPVNARPDPGRPYVLCLIGRDGFGRALDEAAAREVVNGAPVTIRRSATPDTAGACHLAYVHAPSDQIAEQWLAALAGKAVLTITDARDGRARGMVHFAVVQGRVRFHIDAAAAAARGISISSRLLALAVSVRQKP